MIRENKMRVLRKAVPNFLLFLALAGFHVSTASAAGNTMRGWLSDEGCARGRVASGIYTGTNPDCARQCVAKGAKIVLIVPVEKRMLVVENNDAARANVGNYVEVVGTVNGQAATIHIDISKLLEVGRAICGIPSAKKP